MVPNAAISNICRVSKDKFCFKKTFGNTKICSSMNKGEYLRQTIHCIVRTYI